MVPEPEAGTVVPAAPPALAGVRAGVGAVGLTWRPLHAGDLEPLLALVSRCEGHDDPPYRTSGSELAADVFETSDEDLAECTLAGFGPDGELRAYARVRRSAETPADQVLIGGGVDPVMRRQGLGSTLLRWQLERAQALVGPNGRVTTYVEDGMSDQEAMLRDAGFVAERSFTELRRDLALPIPKVQIKAPLSLEPWRPELDDQVRIAYNAAFADHGGSSSMSPQEWRESSGSVVPEWSFLVLDRSTDRTPIAGFLLSGRYEQDWAALGYTAGYTDLLGVRSEYRGRQVASALLVAAMRAYVADGMEYAAMGVDSALDAFTGQMYTRLGFESTRGSTLWARTVVV